MSLLENIYYFFSAKEKALILDDNGEEITKVDIKRKSKIFVYNNGTYNVKRGELRPFKSTKFFFFNHLTYFYNIGNPDPLRFNKPDGGWKPILDPKTYNIMLEVEVIRKLNTLNNGFLKNLKPIHLILGAIAIGVIYYISTGL